MWRRVVRSDFRLVDYPPVGSKQSVVVLAWCISSLCVPGGGSAQRGLYKYSSDLGGFLVVRPQSNPIQTAVSASQATRAEPNPLLRQLLGESPPPHASLLA